MSMQRFLGNNIGKSPDFYITYAELSMEEKGFRIQAIGRYGQVMHNCMSRGDGHAPEAETSANSKMLKILKETSTIAW